MEKEQAKISRTAGYIDAYELSNLIRGFLLSFEGHLAHSFILSNIKPF